MKKLFAVFYLLMITSVLVAQESTIKLNTITDAGALSNIAFAYPNFIKGTVFFDSASGIEAMLNYNRLKDEIYFIDGSNKKMILGKPETISKIVIGADTLYFLSPGFGKSIKTYPNVKLIQKSLIKLTGKEKKVGFGGYSAVSSSSSGGLDLSSEGGQNAKFSVDENLIFSFIESYYFLSSSNKPVKATKKELLNLYPKYNKELKEYIEASHVNFNKKSDLEKLLLYVQTLTQKG